MAVRFAVDELLGEDELAHQGEGYDVVAMLARSCQFMGCEREWLER